MTILIIGATGKFAGLVLPQLKKRGHHITALVQDANKGKQTIENGADEFVIGDLYGPITLKNAAAGIEGVFHIIPAFNREVEAGLNMVKAAQEAGITKFLFSSVYHTSLSLANHAEKRPTEEALYRSGMDYTILQPAMYMQMLQQSWQAAKQRGEIIMPYSKDSKMAYVDYREVAEAAALAMTDKRLSYGTFELASPGMFSRVDLAELMSKKLGKMIIAKDLPVDEWAKQVNIPSAELRAGLIAMNREYDKYGFSGGNSLVLDTILGRQAHTVPQFIEELK